MTMTSESAKSATVKRSEPRAFNTKAGLVAGSDETATDGVVVDIEFLVLLNKNLTA